MAVYGGGPLIVMDFLSIEERLRHPNRLGFRFIVNPTDMDQHYAKAEEELRKKLELEEKEREKRPKFNPETMLNEDGHEKQGEKGDEGSDEGSDGINDDMSGSDDGLRLF